MNANMHLMFIKVCTESMPAFIDCLLSNGSSRPISNGTGRTLSDRRPPYSKTASDARQEKDPRTAMQLFRKACPFFGTNTAFMR